MNSTATQEKINQVLKKYSCSYYQVGDYLRKEENIAKKKPLCLRCDGTGNELYSMYRRCEACNGSGILNPDYDYPLTTTQKRVLLTLRRYWRFGNGGNSWGSFQELAEQINRPLEETKTAVRDMARRGILKHGPAVDTDGRPKGSGYFLTPRWEL